MKKNVFSRTLAVLASTAVLGAASMMSANAAGESLSLSSAEGCAGETVTLSLIVGCNNNFESLDCVVGWDDASLAGSKAAIVGTGASGDSNASDGAVSVVAYGSSDPIPDGAIATIDFTIPADAEVGDTYDVNIISVSTFAIFEGEDLTDTVPTSGGTITVIPEETEPPTDEPTDAPTDEPTDAPTAAPTDAPTAAATTAAATTTKKAVSTGAPKTGTAGVAVAVAGLVTAGATAVVLKKRH